MITIYYNNEVTTIEANTSLNNLLVKNQQTDEFFAVAINRNFIPRANYASTYLQEGDIVEIILPMQGG